MKVQKDKKKNTKSKKKKTKVSVSGASNYIKSVKGKNVKVSQSTKQKKMVISGGAGGPGGQASSSPVINLYGGGGGHYGYGSNYAPDGGLGYPSTAPLGPTPSKRPPALPLDDGKKKRPQGSAKTPASTVQGLLTGAEQVAALLPGANATLPALAAGAAAAQSVVNALNGATAVRDATANQVEPARIEGFAPQGLLHEGTGEVNQPSHVESQESIRNQIIAARNQKQPKTQSVIHVGNEPGEENRPIAGLLKAGEEKSDWSSFLKGVTSSAAIGGLGLLGYYKKYKPVFKAVHAFGQAVGLFKDPHRTLGAENVPGDGDAASDVEGGRHRSESAESVDSIASMQTTASGHSVHLHPQPSYLHHRSPIFNSRSSTPTLHSSRSPSKESITPLWHFTPLRH